MNYRRHIKQPQYIPKIFDIRLSRPWKLYWFGLYFLFLFMQYTFFVWLLPIYERFGGLYSRYFISFLVVPISLVVICEKLKLDGKHIFDFLRDMFIFLKQFVVMQKRVYGYEYVRRKRKRWVLRQRKWGENVCLMK